MRKLTTISAIAMMLLFVNLAFALAENSETSRADKIKEGIEERKARFEERKEKVKEKIEEKKENIKNRFCNRVENRIDRRIDNFEKYKENRVRRHERVRDRIASLADKLDDKGYDTSTLRSHLKTFDGMIKDYASEYSKFISMLGDSKDYTCGESEGKFVDAVKEARSQLKIAKEKRKELREYYRTVIKKDLEDIKNQKTS